MDFATFSAANLKRCQAKNGFNHNLVDWSLSDWITAITGEIGEAANIVKKMNRLRDKVRGNKKLDENLHKKLLQELSDVYIYLDLMFQRLDATLEKEVVETFNNKSEEIGYNDRLG